MIRDAITADGKQLHRTRLALPRPNVIAQYRDSEPTRTAHYLLYRNGQLKLDHFDNHNPDTGNALAHLIVDAPEVLLLAFCLGALVAVILAREG